MANYSDRERVFSFYEMLVYILFQLGLTVLMVQVCMYQSFRGKWAVMVAFSLFTCVNYCSQILESACILLDANKAFTQTCGCLGTFGEVGSFLLYLYLMALSLRPGLVRRGKFALAQAHVWGLVLPAAVEAVSLTIYLYTIYFSADSVHSVEDLDYVIYLTVAGYAGWNVVLKRWYHKKYRNSRCYSWAIVLFFAVTAVAKVFVCVLDDRSYLMFALNECVCLFIDVGPMMAFMYFALYSRSSLADELSILGRSARLDSSRTESLGRSPRKS